MTPIHRLHVPRRVVNGLSGHARNLARNDNVREAQKQQQHGTWYNEKTTAVPRRLHLLCFLIILVAFMAKPSSGSST